MAEAMMSKESQLCAVCDSGDIVLWCTKDGYKILMCRCCGFKYAEFSGPSDFLEKHYGEDFYKNGHDKVGYADYLGDKPNHMRLNKKRVKFVEKYVDGGKLLDVGCAAGYFLEALGSEWDVYGCEPGPGIAKVAAEQFGDRIVATSLEQYSTKLTFDVITLWDVLEHAIDVNSLIDKAHSLLNDDGWLFLSTPDAGSPAAMLLGTRWYNYCPPTHLNYFSIFNIKRFLDKHGFQKKKLTFVARHISLAEIALHLAYTLNSSRIRGLYEKLSDGSRWNLNLPFSAFDEFHIACKKIG
jgi:SAM-dependent methyltransferase